MMNKQRADLTFKDNLKRDRHGWVRLTPAYSVRIVHQILDDQPEPKMILDPFSGTGTTGLVAGQRGINCDLLDINPFLVWLAKAKVVNYSPDDLAQAETLSQQIVAHAPEMSDEGLWYPPISNINRWWEPTRLVTLAKIFKSLNTRLPEKSSTKDLLLVAFCRLIIQWSNAAFNHQSMSFKDTEGTQPLWDETSQIYDTYLNDVLTILDEASTPVEGQVRVFLNDSRDLQFNRKQSYDSVITSPPYANRMSYIRELRPYMFWLGYLETAREAGELDWQAIGGTWGIATSRLKDWQTAHAYKDITGLSDMVAAIRNESPVLANYVLKYFVDMAQHLENLMRILQPGARLFYIVGNSKFYDTLVPTEKLYADIMYQIGLHNIEITSIRKRNSKKELYEFIVSAQKPPS